MTIVLYFGSKKRWNQPLTLLERLNVPEKFRPYINDYKVNLFEIAYLTEEQVKLFKSDFKIVADYLVQERKTGNYIGNTEKLDHVQETLSLLTAMTGDHRFEQAFQAEEDQPDRKEIRTMCDVLDRIEEKGRAKGQAEGTLKTLSALMSKGILTVKQAAETAGMSEAEFKKALASVQA